MSICRACERPLYGAAGALCTACGEAISGHLAVLPALFEQLEEFLEPPRRGGERGARAVEAPIPLNLDVVDLRAELAGVLSGWHEALFEALGWDPPAPVADVAKRVTAAAEALFVNRLWITESWEAAGDFAGELRDLCRSAESIVGPRERSRRLGYCPNAVDGVLCGAVVWLPPAASTAMCRWCGTPWGPERWMELQLAQGKFSDEVAA